jgi:hypothetical protein
VLPEMNARTDAESVTKRQNGSLSYKGAVKRNIISMVGDMMIPSMCSARSVE